MDLSIEVLCAVDILRKTLIEKERVAKLQYHVNNVGEFELADEHAAIESERHLALQMGLQLQEDINAYGLGSERNLIVSR